MIGSVLLLVVQLSSFIVFAIVLTETKGIEENSVYTISAIVRTDVVLECPTETDAIEWRLLNSDNNGDGRILQAHSNALHLNQVTLKDEGIYACFTNKTHAIKKYNLTVYQPPFFTRKMQKVKIIPAGQYLKLDCKAGGIPTPNNITWYKNDESPPTRELGDVRVHRWSLHLEDLIVDDSGNYTCVVCNFAGCINSTVQVDVIERYVHSPILVDHFKNSTVPVGSNVTLQCGFLGNGVTYIEWIKLNNSTNSAETLKTHRQDSSTSIYQIVNVTFEDEGWYKCLGRNPIGFSEVTAYLQVVDDKPTIPTTLRPPRRAANTTILNPFAPNITKSSQVYETEETSRLTTAELQRLVLLEQLKTTKMQQQYYRLKLNNETVF